MKKQQASLDVGGFTKRSTNGSSSNSSSGSINPVLILFCLTVAFTVGFLASPLGRSPNAAACSSSSSPPPSTTVSLAHEHQKSQQPLVLSSAATTTTTTTTVVHEDGFVTHLRMLPDDLLRFHYKCRTPSLPTPTEARSVVLQELFDGKSPFSGFPPPHIASRVKRERIKGWGSDHPVFERLIREVRPSVIVELGTFLGASAINMARLVANQNDDTIIFCLDDFRGWPGFHKTFPDMGHEHGNVMLYNQFLQNVVFSNATGTIVPLPFSTNTGLYKLCELGVVADLIEVDAGHDFHSAWTDINLAWSLMRPGGKSVMFGHDYFNAADYHGVRRAVDLFAELHGLRVEPDGEHWIYRRQEEEGNAAASSSSLMAASQNPALARKKAKKQKKKSSGEGR